MQYVSEVRVQSGVTAMAERGTGIDVVDRLEGVCEERGTGIDVLDRWDVL